jgi:hypothetical protein
LRWARVPLRVGSGSLAPRRRRNPAALRYARRKTHARRVAAPAPPALRARTHSPRAQRARAPSLPHTPACTPPHTRDRIPPNPLRWRHPRMPLSRAPLPPRGSMSTCA